jgi:hypothetical protein
LEGSFGQAGREALAWEWGGVGGARSESVDKPRSQPSQPGEAGLPAKDEQLPWRDDRLAVPEHVQVDAADAAQAARDAGYGHLAPVVGELGGRAVDMEARRFSVVVLEDGNGGAQVVHDHAPGVGAQSSPSRPGPSPEWSVGMQDVVTKVGLHSPSPGMVPLREMASNAEHRLRIVEEDRDLLAQQAVALQRMIDKEHRDRQAALGA